MMMIDDDMHLARRAAKTEFSTVMTAKIRIAGVWVMVLPLFFAVVSFLPPLRPSASVATARRIIHMHVARLIQAAAVMKAKDRTAAATSVSSLERRLSI